MVEQKQINVLFIDDEQHNLTAFRATFRRDYQVFTAISTAEAKEILSKENINIIFSDQRMPNQTGVAFFEEILDKYPLPIRILITGYTDIEVVVDAVNKGKIFKYLQKPWNYEEMVACIQEANSAFLESLEKEKEIEDLKELNEQLEFLARQNIIS